ncbi:MAG: hypothetical protein COA33_010515 [Fluviicola sp.]|nr:hypothetical protein [Fluviicola sp.]
MTFSFAHEVDGLSLDFDTIKYTNSIGNNYSVATLKYFISDIILHKSGGGTVLIDAEHYIDAVDPTTLSFSPTDMIPNGTYTYLSFTFGLDSAKNVSASYLNPPENNMEWPLAMGPGYHYMKLEGKYDSLGIIKNYQCHTGQSMGNPYFVNLTLPVSSFTANGKNLAVELIMNVNKWWESPSLIDLNDVTGIMGNQVMQLQFMGNGADVFRVGSIQ